MQHFPIARWPRVLKVMSALGLVILLGASFAAAKAIVPCGFALVLGTVVACVPAAILLGALLFVVRGYEVEPSRLGIQRLLWCTEIPLAGLIEVRNIPDGMKCSVRICGNGGLFSFTGIYHNSRIGRYRAFVTDPRKCVALFLPKRVVVLSPEDPVAFIVAIRACCPNVKVSEEARDT